MRVDCERCGRGYDLADELRGRAFKMKCKSCDHLVAVQPAGAPAEPGLPPARLASTRGATPSSGDYIDFSLDEDPEPVPARSSLWAADQAVAAAIEAAVGTSQEEPSTEAEVRFVGRGHLHALETPEVLVDAELVPEQQAASVPRAIVGAARGPSSAKVTKGGMPRVFLFGGALAVVVAGALVVATRQKEPPPAPPPNAAEQAAAPEPQPRPESHLLPALDRKPELAAPDPDYGSPPSSGAHSPPPTPAAKSGEQIVRQ